MQATSKNTAIDCVISYFHEVIPAQWWQAYLQDNKALIQEPSINWDTFLTLQLSSKHWQRNNGIYCTDSPWPSHAISLIYMSIWMLTEPGRLDCRPTQISQNQWTASILDPCFKQSCLYQTCAKWPHQGSSHPLVNQASSSQASVNVPTMKDIKHPWKAWNKQVSVKALD